MDINRHAEKNFWHSSRSIFHGVGVGIIIALISSFHTSLALAESCAALKAQMRSAGKTNARTAAPSLLRQLTALRGLERVRQCSTKKPSSGFFDPCRDLAQRRAAVQRQIDHSSAGGGNVSLLRARYAALGCESTALKTTSVKNAGVETKQQTASKGEVSQKQKATSTKSVETAAVSKGKRRETTQAAPAKFHVKGTMLFCVRLEDGYYFPAPNSQFVGVKSASDTLDRCRYICESTDIEVYKLEDMALETEEMTAVDGGQKYADLPNAFAYRDVEDFKGCAFDRYQDRIAEMKARTVTPANMSAANIVLPTRRPNIAADRVDETPPFPGIDPTITADANILKRGIRVILPDYLMPEKTSRPETVRAKANAKIGSTAVAGSMTTAAQP